ncbi:MAG: right-handed parallel beta-helix repeat-containing protein, partial [Candidatus Zixiibacteriota bacterium]
MSLFGNRIRKAEVLVFPAILLLFNILMTESAQTAVEVSGSILGDTTWVCPDTIKVTDQVLVAASGRLTIQAGAVILFSSGSGIFVRGELRAIGERNKRIIFTGAADTSGGSAFAGCWEGLSFLPHSTGLIHHCDVRFANIGIYVDQSSVSLYGCNVEDFATRGIYIDGFESDSLIPSTIEYCSIRQNDTALVGSGVGILVY